MQLSEMVGWRARRYGIAGKTVHLTIRYSDFSTIGKQGTLGRHVNQSDDICRGTLQVLDSIELEQPIRLLRVRITNLCYHREQLPLFEEERRKAFTVSAMDTVNDKFGEFGDFTVTFGRLLGNNEEKGSHMISPARKPEGIRNVLVT